MRDGARAYELARQAFQAQQTIEHAETLAMALAELGRYQEAAELQRQVVAQRQQVLSPEAALERSRRYLELYGNGGVVRAPWMQGG